jgi:hypothetical protein
MTHNLHFKMPGLLRVEQFPAAITQKLLPAGQSARDFFPAQEIGAIRANDFDVVEDPCGVTVTT